MLKKTWVGCVIVLAWLGAGAFADLRLHWSLDEASGNTAHDSVGENHGRLIGQTVWVPGGGKFGGAARFDGADDSVRLTAPAGPFPVSAYPFTLMGWCKTTKSTAKAVIVAVVQQTSFYYWVGVQNGRGCITARSTAGQFEQMGGPTISNDQWHHVCGVYFGPGNRRLYVDGVEGTQDTRAVEFLTGIRRVAVGALDRDPAGENIVDEMLGAVDDVGIFSEALDLATINRYMTHGIPTTSSGASTPSPANGATDVPRDSALRWVPGESAKAHDVYLGTVLAEVEAASRTNALGVLVNQAQDANSYAPATPLEYGQTYYWRIDEVNAPPDATINKGSVWSFTVEPYAYVIRPVTARASSAQANMGPEKTVDGSGLDKSDLHGTEPTTMWLSTGAGPNWIQYEFDKVYKLHELKVWNSNQLIEAFFGLGAKKVTIETSTDGTTWTPLANVPEFARATSAAGYAANTTVKLGGVQAKYVKLTITASWSGMAATGLSEVRFSYIPVQARAPQPAHGTTGISLETDLSWRPGREATAHKVYVGTDPNALTMVQTVTDHRYTPSSLNFGTKYYWKVDEVNTVTYPGDLWSFTTQEFAPLDDFESYTDKAGAEVFTAWVDGVTDGLSNSVVGLATAVNGTFCDTTVFHGGKASMPFEYNNVKAPFYSQAERTFDKAQDWTTHGATHLGLWVRGQPTAFVDKGSGAFTVGASGHDIWDAADDFRFVYKQLNGDGSIVVRVDSLVNTNGWAKAGVMIRQNLTDGSPMVDNVISVSNGVGLQYRLTAGAGASNTNAPNTTGIAAPQWVKLTRKGNDFTAQYSADGKTWLDVKNPALTGTPVSITVSMTGPVYIGLCVTSHDRALTTTAEFSGVAATGNVSGAWQQAWIGDDVDRTNGSGDLYLTVKDSAGKAATVSYPGGANVNGWTLWKIPLSDLTAGGVKTTSIKKTAISVGDPAKPTAGGAGKVNIDDIGYGRPAQ